MRLINPDEIRFVGAPIAPLLARGSVHYEWIAFRDEVNQIPRIEAEPVKHAHWIIKALHDANGEPDFVCSSCFCISPTRGYTRYCPNCGAEMSKETDND
jgi:hypothetical protein